MSFSGALRSFQSFSAHEPEASVGRWTILLGLLSLAYLLLIVRRRSVTRKNDDVYRLQCPPDAHWLWGHEKTAFVDKSCSVAYNEWHEDLSGRNGEGETLGAYRIRGALGYGDIMIPTDPLALSHILSFTSIYHKSPSFRPLIERQLGRSIVWAEGEDHKHMRRALGSCFSEAKTRGWEGIVRGCAQRLADRLLLHALARSKNENVEDEGVIVNMMDWPSRATLDIIGFIGFDHDFECGDSAEAKEIFRLWREQSDMGLTFAGFLAPVLFRQFPFLNALLPLPIKRAQEATKLAIQRLAGPILAREGIHGLLPAEHHLNAPASKPESLDEKGGGTKHTTAAPTDAYIDPTSKPAEDARGDEEAIAKRLSRWRSMDLEGVSGEGNLLTYMIRASAIVQGRQGNRAKEDVDIAELLEHIPTFVMVGHETSAGTVAFTLDALARNPECQSRLRDEISHQFDGVTESDASAPLFAYDDLMDPTKMPYLDAVVKEGLRLYVPPAQTERVAQQDDVIPLRHPLRAADGNILHSVRVQKGQTILLSWAMINSNSASWGPNGASFIPERWLPNSDFPTPEALINGWSHIASFSEGPRICLGYRLALLEVKMILVYLLRDFIFESVNEAPVLDGFHSERAESLEKMDIKPRRTFAGLVQPSIVDGERVGMGGVWLPVRVRPTQEALRRPEFALLRKELED